MDSAKFGKDFLRALKSAVTDRTFPAYDPAWLKHWEDTLLPHAWVLIQKDNAFFNEPREIIPGVNFSEFWGSMSETDQSTMWRMTQMALVHAFLDGDPLSKIDGLVGQVKKWWSGSGGENEELDKILNDDETPSQIKALIDAVLETRLVTILQEVIAELDLPSLGIDPERPESLLESVRDPESPLVQRVMTAINQGIERRVREGRIQPGELQREIERIRALLQQTFGRVLNENLFGAPARDGPAIPAAAFMGTGPEARRQRMLARLQKKQREKNSGDSTKR